MDPDPSALSISYYRSLHCIPKGVLRRVRDRKSVRLQKPLPAPVFMGLRPKPPLVYLFSYYKSLLCIPKGMLRKARDHKFVCLHKPLPASGFMWLITCPVRSGQCPHLLPAL